MGAVVEYCCSRHYCAIVGLENININQIYKFNLKLIIVVIDNLNIYKFYKSI